MFFFYLESLLNIKINTSIPSLTERQLYLHNIKNQDESTLKSLITSDTLSSIELVNHSDKNHQFAILSFREPVT